MDMKSIISILEVGANIGTIAAAVFLIFEFRSAKKAYELSHKDYRIRNEKEEINKAIDLAKFYSELIGGHMRYLDFIFSESGLTKHIENLNIDLMIEFDVDEIKTFLKPKEIEEVKRMLYDIDLGVLIRGNNLIEDVGVKEYINGITTMNIHKKIMGKTMEEAAATLAEVQEDNKDESMNTKSKRKAFDSLIRYNYYVSLYNGKFLEIITDTLNKLEYFAMSFNTKIADEDVVYQSLHQSFLKMINMMYFYIAFQNVDGKDKYYTNIIELYNKWRDRYIEASRIEIESKRAVQTKKNPINKGLF